MAWHVFAIRLLIALLFGALIGAERQWRQRMAGLRPNALVPTGAAMFVMMGGRIAGDGSQGRVAAYVVSGIGFLGGGVILKDGMTIRGLNTAATLWCTAAIGTLSGLGAARFSLVGTLGAIAANTLLCPVGKAIVGQQSFPTRRLPTSSASRPASSRKAICERCCSIPLVASHSCRVL